MPGKKGPQEHPRDVFHEKGVKTSRRRGNFKVAKAPKFHPEVKRTKEVRQGTGK